MANSSQHVEVVSDMLGTLTKGAIVPASSFGDQLQHLLDIGAIENTDDDPRFHSATQTMLEALHSSSPPTLPNAPYVDASVHEVRAVMGPGAPRSAPVTTARTLGDAMTPVVDDTTTPGKLMGERTAAAEKNAAADRADQAAAERAAADKK